MVPKLNDFQKFMSLSDLQKRILLKALGYDLDAEGFIIDENRSRIICKYSRVEVPFESASILPGSTIIINTSPYTISKYIEEYLEE